MCFSGYFLILSFLCKIIKMLHSINFNFFSFFLIGFVT